MVNSKDDTCTSCVNNEVCNFKEEFLEVVDGLCSEYMKQLKLEHNPTWFIGCNDYKPTSNAIENITKEYSDLYE